MKTQIELNEWQALARHHSSIATQHMRDWFNQDLNRGTRFTLQSHEICLDYSRNLITDKTLSLLYDLAHACNLSQKINALFIGENVNFTEGRPALHTALRHPQGSDLPSIANLIVNSQHKLRECVAQIHSHVWRGVTSKPITDIVNIGIGGSHLGPMMTTHALKDFAVSKLQIHYISSIDDSQINEIFQKIDPATTLFIISSKSFTTLETMTNAKTVVAWMKEKLGDNVLHQHFIAITASPENAKTFGIPEEHIFPMWDWVGGRYSIWSAIGLPLMLLIGNQHFTDFLEGAYEMDCHFRQQPFEKNMPVLLGLLSVWYMNFFRTNVQAIVPYVYRLRYLIPYLQQADMESNGKQINSRGLPVKHSTGPIIFGSEGSVGQHAYHQLLHQGQHLVPVDFIMTMEVGAGLRNEHQEILRASCLSQAQALMQGKTYAEAYQELLNANYPHQSAAKLASHQIIPGNKPSNILLLQRLTPKNLGALLALYEHKIFVQSVIWDINPFDQWGVELGKQLLPAILQDKKNFIHFYKKERT